MSDLILAQPLAQESSKKALTPICFFHREFCWCCGVENEDWISQLLQWSF